MTKDKPLIEIINERFCGCNDLTGFHARIKKDIKEAVDKLKEYFDEDFEQEEIDKIFGT